MFRSKYIIGESYLVNTRFVTDAFIHGMVIKRGSEDILKVNADGMLSLLEAGVPREVIHSGEYTEEDLFSDLEYDEVVKFQI